MTRYLRGESTRSHVAIGEQVKLRFDRSRHAVIERDVKTYLEQYSQFAKRQRAVDAAKAREDKAREELAERDAVPDALFALDRVLIGEGARKQNSFKPFGVPAPAACVALPLQKRAEVVTRLVSAVRRSRRPSKAVLAAVKVLEQASAATAPKVAALRAAITASKNARLDRRALERPLRRALSILKLRTRAAELEGLAGLYAELFAAPPRAKKALLPDSAPTPPPA